jgi:hypothetical protein
MSNITIIIPVHEFSETVKGYLDKAIESVDKQEKIEYKPDICIVCSPDISVDIDAYLGSLKYQDTNINRLINNGQTDYQSQVNFATDNIKTNYFCVLEFDDELSVTYLYNFDKYIKSYPDTDVFMPMIIEVNKKNEGLKLTNEPVWSQQFVGENGEMGYLNANALKQYTDFKLSGAAIKKSEFKNIGGYKSNIKLTFMQEFLLRAINNACKVYTIPKIGYKHLAEREDSMFGIYNKTMPMAERKFWFETAVNEANFMNDRSIDMTRLVDKSTN